MPTISRPRRRIAAIVEPAGISPGGGSGPSGRRLCLGWHAGTGLAGISAGDCTPDGCGKGAAGVCGRGRTASAVPHPPTSVTMTRTAVAVRTIRRLTAGTPETVVAITDNGGIRIIVLVIVPSDTVERGDRPARSGLRARSDRNATRYRRLSAL